MMNIALAINGVVMTAIVGFGSYHFEEVAVFDKVHRIAAEQKECLAKNIYFEARNQSELGQRAVAWVTLNRVSHQKYPDTICEVVWQHKQFSWTHDGKSDTPREKKAWEKAQDIALDVLMSYHTSQSDPTSGAIMYHADYAKPYWITAYNQIVEVDNHIFYGDKM